MRVAVFTDNDFAKVNGVTTALRSLIDYAPPNVQPRIYTCEGRHVDTPAYLALRAPGMGIPYYREMRMYLPPVGRLLGHLRKEGTDVIHFTTPGPVGLAALWLGARLRLPIIGSFHTDLVSYAKLLSGSDTFARWMKHYLRWTYGQCEIVFVPSEATGRQLVGSGIAVGRHALWKRGVCTDRFSPAKRSDALRRRWRAVSTVPVLIYVGRLSREKGLDRLPALVRRLSELRVAHQLVLVGDGPLRAQLEAALPDAIFTGTLTPDDVATAMASADLFVFPSRTDTAGNVVLEAQASGLPVIVTTSGGPREHMADGVSGVACPDDSSFEIAAISLLHDHARRRACASGARAYALASRWPVALAPVYEAYARLVGARTASRLGPQPVPIR